VTTKNTVGPARAHPTWPARPGRCYPSDLSDAEWALIGPLLPDRSRRGRPPVHHRRVIVNAILYVNRTGCAWRYLPKDFPPWRTVYG
jgi:transposase